MYILIRNPILFVNLTQLWIFCKNSNKVKYKLRVYQDPVGLHHTKCLHDDVVVDSPSKEKKKKKKKERLHGIRN